MRDTTPAPAHVVESLQSRLGRSHVLRFLTALLLAIVTWGWVMQATDPIRTTTYAEVEIVSPEFGDGMVMVTNLPRAVIRVQGPESEVAKINRALIIPRLDTSTVNQPGEYRLPVVVDAPDTSNRITVDPSHVQVRIDEVVSTDIPLEIEESTTENTTRLVNTISPEVSQVTISGPSSAVDRVSRVILPVTIDSQITSFSAVYTPYAVDENDQRVSEVTVLPTQVTTRVELQSRGRVVSVIADVTGEPAEGYTLSQRNVLPGTITVEGPEDVLDSLLFVHTDPVDITGASQPVSQRVGLADLPAGVTVIDPPNGQVEVRVAIQDSSSTVQTLSGLPVNPLNAPEGFEVAIEPDSIDVTVDGSVTIISGMTPEDITVVVDVRGLEAGTYDLRPVVALPSNGVRISDTNPDTVSVTIRPASDATPVASPSTPAGLQPSQPQAMVRRRYAIT
jgi:YbbR domain-containing protein